MLMPGVEAEHPVTKKVLAAMPEAQAALKPHEKSMNALDLAWHIAASEVWFLNSIADGKIGAEDSNRPPTLDSFAKILDWYSAEFAAGVAKVKAMSGEQLAQPIDFFGILNLPAVAYLNLLNNHSVHHRGQFSVYLRLAGAKVPSIYGGSADEPFQPPS